MKALFCQKCGSIVSPPAKDLDVRWCDCQRHAIWWLKGERGIVRVHDIEGPTPEGPAAYNRRAWLLGISNELLEAPDHCTEDGEFYSECFEQRKETGVTLFQRYGTFIVRFRPGETGDSAYAQLPA